MSINEEKLDFSVFWKVLSESWEKMEKCGGSTWHKANDSEKLKGLLREIIELLCGALWHFELAQVLGDFSEKSYKNSVPNDVLLWPNWWKSRKNPSVKFGDKDSFNLDLIFEFNNTPNKFHNMLIQNMFLANGCLRLAGVWDLIERNYQNKPIEIKNIKCQLLGENSNANVMDTIKYQKDQNHNITIDCDDLTKRINGEDITVWIIFILVFRDSFMHGETPPKKNKPRYVFRENWLREDKPLNYCPAVIAKACYKVFDCFLEKAASGFN